MRGTLARGAVGAVVGGAAWGVAEHLSNRQSGSKGLGARMPKPKSGKTPGLDAIKRAKPKSGKAPGLDAIRRAKPKPGKLADRVDVKQLGRSVEKLGRNVDLKQVARQIGNIAEQVEARSDDVHTLSGQTKRISRRISED